MPNEREVVAAKAAIDLPSTEEWFLVYYAFERRRVNIPAAQNDRDPLSSELSAYFQRSSERGCSCAFGQVVRVKQKQSNRHAPFLLH
jgi:hypothetical protein